MASNKPDSSLDAFPSSRFRSPSLPPSALAPSPVHSDENLALRDSTSSKTMANDRNSVSPPLVDRQGDQTVRDSPVSPRSRSPSTPPLPTVLGSPNSAKPLPTHPTIATENPIPMKNPDRYSTGRFTNMTNRTTDKPLNSEMRRSTRRAESMAPSYTSTVTPSKLRTTRGPFDRISTEPNFAARVFDAGKHDLLYEVDQSTRWPWKFEDVKHGVLDLTTLLRMQQHVLQQKLVAQVNALGQKGAWMEIGVGETMKEYCQLTRDMDYINSTSSARGASPTTNPFLISTTDPLEAQLLEEGGLIARRGGPSANNTNPSSPTSTEPEKDKDGSLLFSRLPYTTEPTAPWRRHLRHWLAVISSAIALILPFLVMTLTPTLTARLATTCVMVAVFALVAAASEVRTSRAVAYVLGYAGALVVFGGLVPPAYWG